MKEKEFNLIINDLINNETVLEMKKYYQHGSTSCFEHCYNVAYVCYKMAKKLGLDYVSATRGAMLHDLFLYDWRTPKKDRVNKKMHAFTHGKIALNNATKLFKLNDTEKDMILRHMWPVTLKMPKTKEGFLLTLADKYCAIIETKNDIMYNLNKIYYFNYLYIAVILIFRGKIYKHYIYRSFSTTNGLKLFIVSVNFRCLIIKENFLLILKNRLVIVFSLC